MQSQNVFLQTFIRAYAAFLWGRELMFTGSKFDPHVEKGRKSGFLSYWYLWIELENTRRLVSYIIMSVPDLVV